MPDAIEMVIEPHTARVGNGTVRRILPFRKRRMIGPFIFADLIEPEDLESGIGTSVDAHPRIGLSTHPSHRHQISQLRESADDEHASRPSDNCGATRTTTRRIAGEL